MWTQQYTPDPRIPGIGLAFFLDRLDGHRIVRHAGNLPGFASALTLAPDDGTGVIVLTNTSTVFGAPLISDTVLAAVLNATPSPHHAPVVTSPSASGLAGS